MLGDTVLPTVLGAVPEGRMRAVCGQEPGLFCREVLNRTGDRTYAELADVFIGKPLKIALILVVALIANRLARRLTIYALRRIGRRQQNGGPLKAMKRLTPDALTETREMSIRGEQRAEAVGSILKSVVTVIVWTVAAFMILAEVGVNLGPLIAGAGIVGVALGFGAQSLVKDFLTGIFILMEDQYGVGDTIQIDPQTSGVVEGVGLRSTRMRGIDGTVWHVPNGSIVIVGNQSQHWSRALMDVEVAYDTDVQLAKDVILRVAERQREEDPHILEPPEVWGVQTLGINGITIRLVVKTTPSEQFRISRVLNERLMEAFAENGIEIPFPQQTIHYKGDAVAEVATPQGQRPLVAPAPVATTAAPGTGPAVDPAIVGRNQPRG